MDLVDVARAVAKRWWLAAIVIGAGVALALSLAGSIEPTYEVRADSLFVGPAGFDDTGGTTPTTEGDTGNPYLRFSGSLEVTSEAVARRVDGFEFRAGIADEGYSGDFEFEGASNAPLLTIIATADQPDDATALAERVVTGLEDNLKDLQDEAGVPQDQQIVARTLTTSEPTSLAGDRNRVAVGTIVLSVVLAVGACMALESIDARRRARALEKQTVRSEVLGDIEVDDDVYDEAPEFEYVDDPDGDSDHLEEVEPESALDATPPDRESGRDAPEGDRKSLDEVTPEDLGSTAAPLEEDQASRPVGASDGRSD
jgi:capsular polysaccharide biosynthesis protein